MQSTNVILIKPDTYGKMAEMSSGSSFVCGINSRATSFRNTSFNGLSSKNNNSRAEVDNVEFIDEKEDSITDDTNTNNSDALYNFPWDFKNKASQLLLQTSLMTEEASRQSSLLKPVQASVAHSAPAPPQCPPPSTLQHNNNASQMEEVETEYSAPWDLKLQEEMFKKMSQLKKEAAEKELMNNNSSLNRTELNVSIKSNKSLNDSTPRQSLQPSQTEETNEYSPPWELKQTVLLQSLQSHNTNNSNPKPLCTSSATSTLTNTTTNNPTNPSALSSLFNQFSRTRLSTRSNTSSSSSTRSSTSSLSASSPPSIPLPPSIPPPPPPMSNSIHRCNSLCSHNTNTSQQIRHLCHTNSSSNLPGCNNNNNNSGLLMSRVSGNNNSCNSSCSLKNTILINSNTPNTNSGSYLNESMNKFSSWGTNNTSSSNSSNTNSSEANFVSDENKSSFSKQQNRMNSTNQHQQFAYPSMISHFQAGGINNGQHCMNIDTSHTMNNKTIQIGGIPVTALVFQQTSSLPANFLPLNMQNQLVSPTSLAHLRLLERQIWFHGKITRKHAETMLDNRTIGSFLIRQSESGNANDFSLSLVGSGVVHMRVSMKSGEYILGQCSQPFNSIVKMVEHYGKVEVPIKGALHVRLTHPVGIHK